MREQRFDTLDALRGLAMVWMTVFHFSFDLNQFGLIKQDFYRDPVWTWQRTCIVSLFLLCAGAGQAVAVAQGQSWQRFWRRWGQLVACAVLVSVGSWFMFPNSFIYFGVLHGMAVMLILVRLTVSWGRWLWWLGALAIASKFIANYALHTWASADFVQVINSMRWNWLGWISQKPVTEDYVPVFPWLGVMWWGAAAAQWLMRSPTLSQQKPPKQLPKQHLKQPLGQPISHPISHPISQPTGQPHRARLVLSLPHGARGLALMGRWSLSYYMLHQPVLIGLALGLSKLLA